MCAANANCKSAGEACREGAYGLYRIEELHLGEIQITRVVAADEARLTRSARGPTVSRRVVRAYRQ